MSKVTYFSSEFVSPGHPDKVCDTIAESVVDYAYEQFGPKARVAVDGCVKNNTVVLVGECTNADKIPFEKLTRGVLSTIGYTEKVSSEFNDATCQVLPIFTTQSANIAQGVDHVEKESSGDIGIMFGGAVNEAPDYTCWSHFLARYLSYYIYKHNFSWAKPDQKTQVTIKYADGVPVGISHIVVCISHDENKQLLEIREEIKEFVEEQLAFFQFPNNFETTGYKLDVNPTGKFAIYGPIADAGEVGRKIVCDQYGGFFPVGGGNLNGKDASKTDRSGVYMARWVAKQIVAKGMADKCCIQVSYVIGQLEPASINIETYGTNKVSEELIEEFVNQFSFIPGDIITRFKLNLKHEERGFFYQNLGSLGHIGYRFNGEQLPWETVE